VNCGEDLLLSNRRATSDNWISHTGCEKMSRVKYQGAGAQNESGRDDTSMPRMGCRCVEMARVVPTELFSLWLCDQDIPGGPFVASFGL
jgi:hypothetical protein